MSTPAAVQEKKQQKWPTNSGMRPGPFIAFVIGVEGVGKSTFANDAGAWFIDVEHSTDDLDADRFDEPEGGWTWPTVLDLVRWLGNGEHGHKRVALDTVDALESLIWKHICGRDDKANIEAYGFAKGYNAALDEWKVFVAAIEQCRDRRGMDVFLLAHSEVKTFKNPEGEDFDRYQPALHVKAGGLLKGRSNIVLFANFETFARKKDERSKVEKAKGVSTDRRLIYTTRTAAYDAKNRRDLPPSMLLDWAVFDAALRASANATTADLRKLIEEKAARMKALKGADGEKQSADALAAIKRIGDDKQKLRQLNNWATDKLEELSAP